MKTLVIHPKDNSTDFLKLIYKDKGYDVINSTKISKANLRKAIEKYDRIIMLGHGTPSGLINPNYRIESLYLIDSSFVDLLKQKETISIWCNSDKFFSKYNIKGFHTGMIISECAEQDFVLGKVYLEAESQLKNMEKFSRIVSECIDKTPLEMQEHILKYYTDNDEVTNYNRKNIIVL